VASPSALARLQVTQPQAPLMQARAMGRELGLPPARERAGVGRDVIARLEAIRRLARLPSNRPARKAAEPGRPDFSANPLLLGCYLPAKAR